MLVLDDEDGRGRLADDCRPALEALGVYRRERRGLAAPPHRDALPRAPRRLAGLPELGPFSPSEAAVYHSVLRPTGAQYEILEAVALGGVKWIASKLSTPR